MKKLILLIILFFGMFPLWEDGAVTLFHGTKARAQNTNYTLQTYLQTTNVGNGHSYVISSHSCGCQVVELDSRGQLVRFHNANNYAANSSSYQQYLQQNNITYDPDNSDEGDNSEDEDDENDDDMVDSEFFDELVDVPTPSPEDIFQPSGGYGSEPTYEPQTCTAEMGTVGFSYEFFEAAVNRDDNYTSFSPPSVTLPCLNKFLIANKIVYLNSTYTSGVQGYKFDGTHLSSIVYSNGDQYGSVVWYDVVREVMQFDSWNPDVCGEDREEVTTVFTNPTGSVKFMAKDKIIADLNTLASQGISLVEGKLRNGTSITGLRGVPDNLAGYAFTIPASDVSIAQVGDQVMVKKAGVNEYYCITLTAEDVDRGLRNNRDKKYVPDDVGINLQHFFNIPNWLRNFLELIPDFYFDQCTKNHVNAKLADLHQRSEYTAAPPAMQRDMEFRTLAYELFFGYFKCATNEESVKGSSIPFQIGVGMLNELIQSFDVVQIKDGLIKLAQGLGSTVLNNVKYVIDDIKDAAIEQVTTGTIDYEKFMKKVVSRHVANFQDGLDKAYIIADNFYKMYFSQCDQWQFQDGSFGSVCAYRKGQLIMMILPIILTGGDYAVVKLTALATKYGSSAKKAIELLEEARSLGAKVDIDNAAKLVIKDADDADALVLTTQEKTPGINDVTITGEQSLTTIIDPGDLNQVGTPVTPVNNVVTVAQGNKTNGWTRQLNQTLDNNTTYEVGNFKYKTDASGRVEKVEVPNITLNASDRNRYQQSYKCKKIKDGQTGDDGGHLIASQFGGPGEQINYVPMSSTINQAPGTWYAMETDWKNALLAGGTVTDIEITIIYGANKRPTGFQVTCEINGVQQVYNHSN